MSLYHYFESKDALLAAVARTVATPEPPSALPHDAHWTDYFASMSVSLRRTIVAHPHCAPLLVRYMPRLPLPLIPSGCGPICAIPF